MRAVLTAALLLLYSIAYSQGVEWTEVNPNFSVKLNAVSACDQSNVWACGDSGYVLRSSSSGGQWHTSNVNRNISLSYILACNTGTAFTSGVINDTAFIFKTTNSGSSWNTVFHQKGTQVNVLWMHDEQSGIVIADPAGGRWSIWKTTNHGITWDSTNCYLKQQDNEKGNPRSFHISFNLIWFGTDNYRIYHSLNYGMTWITQSTPAEKNIYSIWMQGNEGYAGGNNVLRTINNGATWNLIPNTYGDKYRGFAYYPFYTEYIPGYLLTAREDNKIYESSDNGSGWYEKYSAPAGNFTHLTSPRYQLYPFWGIRDNGGISKGMVYFGIKKISSGAVDEFVLGQNYPNPFNPKTKIKFSTPKSPKGDLIKLIIYDVMGRKVRTLENESANSGLNAGEYEVEFDGSSFASGLYFYSLVVDDRIIDTKKMLLVK